MVESATKTVLLLGEGNFSYALARARQHLAKPTLKLNLIATSFDSESELATKYPESGKILSKLHEIQCGWLAVKVFHRVDATQIAKTLLPFEVKDLHECTFCHPHIGCEDLRKNSSLVAHFFHSSLALKPSFIQITLLEGQYDRWQVEKVSQLNLLKLVGRFAIDPVLLEEYGYETKRHQSGKSFSVQKVSKSFSIVSKAYVFAPASTSVELSDLSAIGCAPEISMQKPAPNQEDSLVCENCGKNFG